MTQHRVLGVDACKAGWVGVVLGDGFESAHVAGDIETLVAAASVGGLQVVGIDIPIGLPDSSSRIADLDAQKALGPRRSSLFMTPVRSALMLSSHAQASQENRDRAGIGISIQAYGLRRKILEVDDWVRGRAQLVREVHPELSFIAMGGGVALSYSKHSWGGLTERRARLAGAGIQLPDSFRSDVDKVGADDILDAAAAAWSAQRIAGGQAVSRPSNPEKFSDEWPAAIWT